MGSARVSSNLTLVATFFLLLFSCAPFLFILYESKEQNRRESSTILSFYVMMAMVILTNSILANYFTVSLILSNYFCLYNTCSSCLIHSTNIKQLNQDELM